MKKLIAFLALVALVVSLGCTGGETPKATGGATKPAETGASTEKMP